MARLQILELPTEHHGDDMVTPFVLVVDQSMPQRIALGADAPYADYRQSLADRIGARGVIVTPETVEIPANEVGANPEPLMRVGEPTTADDAERAGITQIVYAHERTRLDLCDALLLSRDTTWRQLTEHVRSRQRELADAYRKLGDVKAEPEGDINCRDEATGKRDATESYGLKLRHLGELLDEARMWARHGYEIGQRHCGWADHGVTPEWLTEGWPPHIDSCEHLKHAAELEEVEAIRKRVAKEQKAALTDALGMDRLRDWDDILNAAAGLRRERDAKNVVLQWVRDFPEAPESADSASGPSREYLAGYRDAVEAVRRGTYGTDKRTDA